MNNAPPFPQRGPDRRTVADELPRYVGLLPGEAELVAQHMLDSVEALFAGRPSLENVSPNIAPDQDHASI